MVTGRRDTITRLAKRTLSLDFVILTSQKDIVTGMSWLLAKRTLLQTVSWLLAKRTPLQDCVTVTGQRDTFTGMCHGYWPEGHLYRTMSWLLARGTPLQDYVMVTGQRDTFTGLCYGPYKPEGHYFRIVS